eukprot:Opistho-2@8883
MTRPIAAVYRALQSLAGAESSGRIQRATVAVELTVWHPSPFFRSLFCLFSPAHVAFVVCTCMLTGNHAQDKLFYTVAIHALLSLMLFRIVQMFEDLIRDKQLIAGEAYKELNRFTDAMSPAHGHFVAGYAKRRVGSPYAQHHPHSDIHVPANELPRSPLGRRSVTPSGTASPRMGSVAMHPTAHTLALSSAPAQRHHPSSSPIGAFNAQNSPSSARMASTANGSVFGHGYASAHVTGVDHDVTEQSRNGSHTTTPNLNSNGLNLNSRAESQSQSQHLHAGSQLGHLSTTGHESDGSTGGRIGYGHLGGRAALKGFGHFDR